MFWDINSMYVSTYNEKFPTGLGFKWILEENSDFLKKTLLTKKNISISSIEWISTIQQSSKFIDKQGKRCKIRYGWNSEECSIGPYSVDGLCLGSGLLRGRYKVSIGFDSKFIDNLTSRSRTRCKCQFSDIVTRYPLTDTRDRLYNNCNKNTF